MKRPVLSILLGLFAVAVCRPAPGLETTFDISGFEIFGEFDDEFPSFSTDYGGPVTITHMTLDVTGESFGDSWNSEITFAIDTGFGFVDNIDFGFVDIVGGDVGLPDESGPFALTTTVPAFVESIDGNVAITLYEQYDDHAEPDAPDSAFGPDSSLTITYEPYVPGLPPEATDLGLIAAAATPFSIDTFGSNFDTELGLYNADGIFLAMNDDSNANPQSELEMLKGLPSGDYFVAIGGFNTEFEALGFGAMPQDGSGGGDFVLNYPTGSTSGILAAESVEFFSFSIGTMGPSADFNGDGAVDGNDFLLWQGSFQVDDGGDADGDGDTDGDDFLIWQTQFGSGEGAASGAVPEPAAGTLWVAALAVSFLRRRRH